MDIHIETEVWDLLADDDKITVQEVLLTPAARVDEDGNLIGGMDAAHPDILVGDTGNINALSNRYRAMYGIS